jgi:glycosyltransferase involved in cell wall biosynthesis
MEACIAHLRVVISAVNFTEGGALSVLRECLAAAVTVLPIQWEIVALVNDANLINEPRARLISIASAKKSWFYRLYWEWFGFMRISRQLKPTLWLSLHDITPRVLAKRQVVYCHNPSPFYNPSLREAITEPKFLLFNWLYKYLYQVNIHRNYAVVVQQEWLRSEFYRLYGHSNIIVAHPSQQKLPKKISAGSYSGKTIFLYPALPRVFKNFEVLCRAVEMLPDQLQSKIEIRLTIDGTENIYAKKIKKSFGHIKPLRFLGKQNQEEMFKQYCQCDAVLFPSKLETWGLPISESKDYSKPILASDLQYARETVGTYTNVSFLPPDDFYQWADAIKGIILNEWVYSGNIEKKIPPPFAKDWNHLWTILKEGL